MCIAISLLQVLTGRASNDYTIHACCYRQSFTFHPAIVRCWLGCWLSLLWNGCLRGQPASSQLLSLADLHPPFSFGSPFQADQQQKGEKIPASNIAWSGHLGVVLKASIRPLWCLLQGRVQSKRSHEKPGTTGCGQHWRLPVMTRLPCLAHMHSVQKAKFIRQPPQWVSSRTQLTVMARKGNTQ